MKHLIPVIGICALLTACGTTPEERGVSGAGIGAGAGAIVGAVTGLTVVEGAVLGAVAGGLTGALTDEEDVNLGKPAWKQGSSSSSSNQAVAHAEPVSGNKQTVMAIQRSLKTKGYDPGVVDGISGARTQEAIRNYQRDNGLLVDGLATQALLDHMNQRS